ncbi:DUF3291 domain-containing protein [Lipingzhangella sp. LS1_29]|uniref:DUF3291 domain-containing protein n=1 Tax=Lipingzhangella rawalii TaxID=2055835 RepID=A0ABU2H3V9_9ACTN|nr:DUF3291 domain-containing protein [Lipingzhangella rawalii]MDS1269535.1 DUF3291 domain-containing protein [Lipingzhangella rawalii]
MPTLGWITPNPTQGHERALILASRFEVAHWWQVPGFLRFSIRAWRQVSAAPGALGASLQAQPLRRVFWTLSAWTDEETLRAYARSDPHREIMRAVRSSTRTATLVRWTLPVDQLPPSWGEARDRLAAAAHRNGVNGD